MTNLTESELDEAVEAYTRHTLDQLDTSGSIVEEEVMISLRIRYKYKRDFDKIIKLIPFNRIPVYLKAGHELQTLSLSKNLSAPLVQWFLGFRLRKLGI